MTDNLNIYFRGGDEQYLRGGKGQHVKGGQFVRGGGVDSMYKRFDNM